MAPLPPLWDPARAVDKLPQPYRMLDKLLGEIIELALDVCYQKAASQRLETACRVSMMFTPHAILPLQGNTTCFTPAGLGGCMVTGADDGKVALHSARFPGSSEVDAAHDSPVLAVVCGHNVPLFIKVAASVSQRDLALYAVNYKTMGLQRLAKLALPVEPPEPAPPAPATAPGTAGGPAASAPPPQVPLPPPPPPPVDPRPCCISFSPNACHLAVGYASGALAVYSVDVEGSVDTVTAEGVSTITGATVMLLVHLSAAALRAVPGMFPPGTKMGASHFIWALQQRPDKSGRSDAFHKSAYGVYAWWYGCDRVLLCKFTTGSGYFNAMSAAAATPSTSGPALPGAAPAAPAAAGGTTSGTAVRPVQGPPSVITTPGSSWLLPHPILCASTTLDGTMQAFGLADGSVVIWSDPFGGPTRVLPRLSAPVTAVSYVNHTAEKIMCASEDGRLVVIDLLKPEDSSQREVQLPLPVAALVFLPSEPLALCVCPGNAAQRPRFMWYHTEEERLVAELVAPAEHGFGPATLHPANTTAAPPPPGGGTASGTAGKTASGTSVADMSHLPYPAWAVRDSYLVMGGHVRSTEADEFTAAQAFADVYMFKLDAVAHKILPDPSLASKMLLNNALVELEPQKRRKGKKVRVEMDKDQPHIKSAMKGHNQAEEGQDDGRPSSSRASSRGSSRASSRESSIADFTDVPIKLKITFTDLDHAPVMKKDPSAPAKPTVVEGFHGVTSKGSARRGEGGVLVANERPKSPPWHHTNPTSRIHPDWEESPYLIRIMERLSTKGGGRRRRDKKILAATTEMTERFAREKGAKHNLLVQ